MNNNTSYDINQVTEAENADKTEFRRICNNAGFMTLATGMFFFAFSFTISEAFKALLRILPELPSNVDSLPDSIYSGIINLVAIGLLGLVFIKINKNNKYEQLPVKKVSGKTLNYLIIIGFSVCMLSNYLTNLFLSNAYDLGINLYHESLGLPRESFIEILFYILSVAAVPAVSEEILFRGALLSTLRKHSDGIAILVSSLIFGLFHGNFVQFPFAFIVGLVLSLTVVYTNSMLPAIAIHFINNLFSIICDLLSRNSAIWGIDLTICNIIINFFISALIIVAIFFAKKISETDRTFLSLNRYSGKLTAKEVRKEFFKSPGILAAALFLSIETISNHLF